MDWTRLICRISNSNTNLPPFLLYLKCTEVWIFICLPYFWSSNLTMTCSLKKIDIIIILDGKNIHNFKLKSLVKISNEYLKTNFLVFPRVGSIPDFASAYFKNLGSNSLIYQNKLKAHSIFKSRSRFCSCIFSRKKIKMPRHPLPCVDVLSAKGSVEWTQVPQCLIPTFYSLLTIKEDMSSCIDSYPVCENPVRISNTYVNLYSSAWKKTFKYRLR